jgi:hypothetical protein
MCLRVMNNIGGSDSGDNWRLECSTGNWLRDAPVRFVHIDTNKALYTTKGGMYLSLIVINHPCHAMPCWLFWVSWIQITDMFNQNNCRNCPIQGQLEITAHGSSPSDVNSLWLASDGIFFVDRNFERKTTSPVDADDEMDARYVHTPLQWQIIRKRLS